MSVRRRKDSGGWLIHIKITGKPEVRRTVSSTLTRAQANAIERTWRTLIEQGQDPLAPADARRPTLATWGDLRAAFWEKRGQHHRSADRTEDHLTRISAAIGDDKALTSLTTADVADAVARWRVETVVLALPNGKHRSFGVNGPVTINTRLRHLKAVLAWGRETLGLNVPTIAWKAVALEEPDRDPMSMHIAPAIRDAVAEAAAPHVRWSIRLAEETGFRISSVLGLRWERLDREHGIGTAQAKSRKPGGKVEVFPLTPEILGVLDEIAAAYRAAEAARLKRPVPVEAEWPAEGPVITFRGKAIRSIKKAVRSARAKAGAPGFIMKNVRHSTAIEIIAATGSIAAAAATLGHSDTGVTEKHYGRVDVAAVRKALEQRSEQLKAHRSAKVLEHRKSTEAGRNDEKPSVSAGRAVCAVRAAVQGLSPGIAFLGPGGCQGNCARWFIRRGLLVAGQPDASGLTAPGTAR